MRVRQKHQPSCDLPHTIPTLDTKPLRHPLAAVNRYKAGQFVTEISLAPKTETGTPPVGLNQVRPPP